MHTVAWTGHRPKDLPGVTYQQFAQNLDLLGMDERKDVQFVVGGALGVDTWAAEYAISRGIPFQLVLPFRPHVMSKFWPDRDVDTLFRHIQLAVDVQIIHDAPTYDVRAYQLRNEFMVNVADHVFAVWTGKKDGGTFNCIRYALSQRKPVHNIWPMNGKVRPIKEV